MRKAILAVFVSGVVVAGVANAASSTGSDVELTSFNKGDAGHVQGGHADGGHVVELSTFDNKGDAGHIQGGHADGGH